MDAQAATAVLHEAASPTAAPSDGLASVLSGLVSGTAGNGAAGTQLSPAAGAADDAADAAGRVAGQTPGQAAGQAAGSAAGVPVPGAALGTPGTVLTGTAVQLGPQPGAQPGTQLGAQSASQAGTAPGSQPAVAGTPGAASQSSVDGAGGAAGDPAGVTAPPPEAGPSAADRGPQVGGERGGAAGAASATTTAASGPAGVGPGPSGVPTGSPDPQGVRGAAITDQVFDHVTRLVSRGDGTHRITLRLHPADLGEVHVTLTARDGTVDVTLAAGSAAREALREGSPQLRSLLELAGAATGQVVIREPSGSAAAQQQAFGSAPDQGQQPGRDPQAAATHDDARGDGGARDGAPGHGSGAGTPYRSNIDGGTDLPGAADPAPRGPLATPSRLDLNL
jgi:flagellar hook-length control protein FliK